jgi:CBS domain-containing protein
MRDFHVSALFATEQTGAGMRVHGIVTDRDIVVHGLAGAADCSGEPVSTVMTHGIVTVDGAAAVSDALRMMLTHGVHRLAVLGRVAIALYSEYFQWMTSCAPSAQT